MQEGETGVVLSGYNLAQTGTNWVRVYNGSRGLAYDDVAVTASGSPYTSMTVSLAAVTHSGWLRLAVNGVEAINNKQRRPRHQQGGRRQRPRLHPVERRPLPEGLGSGRLVPEKQRRPVPVHVHHGRRHSLRRLDQLSRFRSLRRHDGRRSR